MSNAETFEQFHRDRHDGKFERVGPTALSVAYRRTLTDIPYAQEVYDEMERMRIANGEPDIPKEIKTPDLAPQLEARYKLVNRLLEQQGTRQVLEVAAGFSPRGLEFADQGIPVVEMDLPGIMDQKARILSRIGPRDSLRLVAGNAIESRDFKKASQFLDAGTPVSVVNEGLMRYLSFDEKAAYARNVHTVLERFGGAWITPDITLTSILQTEDEMAKKNAAVQRITGINVDKNRFKDVNQAEAFFSRLGFSVERHNFMEIADELVSPQRLKLSREKVERMISPAYVFVMKVK